jgi:hypothetical protein
MGLFGRCAVFNIFVVINCAARFRFRANGENCHIPPEMYAKEEEEEEEEEEKGRSYQEDST